jgi:hypothetical protein
VFIRLEGEMQKFVIKVISPLTSLRQAQMVQTQGCVAVAKAGAGLSSLEQGPFPQSCQWDAAGHCPMFRDCSSPTTQISQMPIVSIKALE